MRMTAFLPVLMVGMLESRKFAVVLPMGREKRPSWGKRVSAMFRCADDLEARDQGAVELARIGQDSRRLPSMRKRMRDCVSCGSMWMSVARSRRAIVDDLVEDAHERFGVGECGKFVGREVRVVEDGGALEFVQAFLEVLFAAVVDQQSESSMSRGRANTGDTGICAIWPRRLTSSASFGCAMRRGQYTIDDIQAECAGLAGDFDRGAFATASSVMTEAKGST
jgi:hypothetical protein